MSNTRRVSNWWFVLQAIVWIICFSMIGVLFFAPKLGLHAFWDVLIPVAPALVALLPGVWRNICPAASMSQLPRHLRMTKRKKLSTQTQGRLIFLSVVLLLVIIPLRHTYFDLNGVATGVFLVISTLVAIGMTYIYDGKSGWCASLCPVHQVEKLYGQRPVVTVGNINCAKCSKCVTACPDSTTSPSPHVGGNTSARRIATFGLIGIFPGYVWGWFQVQDYGTLSEGLANISSTYVYSLIGGAITLTLYAILIKSISVQRRDYVDRFFAAAAISCYYWYRLPWLLGFSQFDGNGMLVDMTETISPTIITLLPYFTTAFWIWWIALKPNGLRSWMPRPPYEDAEPSMLGITISA